MVSTRSSLPSALASTILATLIVITAVGLLATGGAVAAEDVRLDVATSAVDIGDESQALNFRLGGIEPGNTVDVYVNVTSLESANIALDDVGIEVGDAVVGASVTDTEVVKEDETVVVRVSITLDEDAERAAIETYLTGLDTGDADPTTDLQHYAAISDVERVGDNAPDKDDQRSTPYDVIDPAEADLHTQVSPQSVEIGTDEQAMVVRVAEATDDFVLRIDLTPLTEADVEINNAAIDVEETYGFDITDTTLTDGVIELRVAVEDEGGGLHFRMIDLETDDATPTEDLTYPVFVDGEPADPEKSSSFDVFNPGERDDNDQHDEATPMPTHEEYHETPVDSSISEDPAAGGEGGDENTDKNSGANDTDPPGVEAPGFGPVVAILATVVAVLLVRRGQE